MMTKSKRLKRYTAVIVGVLLVVSLAFGGVSVLPAHAATNITVNVNKPYQEFDGWGLSLSWWATEMGDWTRTGASGMSKREELMEALYGESGLNLNIARYNVGGGDDPTHTHMTDDRNTPGWRGATLVQEGDNEYYVPNARYYFEDENGNYIPWQDTPDHRQLWVLDWIQKNRDDVVMEYYSNSPPYWMTKSGCTSGAVKGANDPKEGLSDHDGRNWNMIDDDAHNAAFVRYLLDVYEYLTAQGFELGNIQPFNESGPNYWYWAADGDQEGCHFSAEQQVEILRLLDLEMRARGIDAAYNYGDETNPGRSVNTYNLSAKHTTRDGTSGADVIAGAGRLTYHIYSRGESNEKQMYVNAKNNGQEIYMSEVSYQGGAAEYDPNDMSAGFAYTNGIIDMLRIAKVDGYVFWQGMEDMVGQIKNGTNWGLIQGVYYTQDEGLAQGTDLAAMGMAYQDYVLSKSYYMSGQYTKYIRPGYTILDTDDNKTVAALSPDGKTLVIVKENQSNRAQSLSFRFDGFHPYAAEKIVTDRTHNWEKSSIDVLGGAINDDVTPSSVTTYVLHGNYAAATGHFIDDSSMQQRDSLQAIQAAFAAGGDTEQMYGTFPVNGGGNAVYFNTSYTRKAGDWLAFRFYGEAFDLVGTKKNDSGKITVWIDQDPTNEENKHGERDLYSSSTVSGDTFYSVTGLEKGWHTVYVRADAGRSSRPYVNYDAVFLFADTGDDPATDTVDYLNITAAYGAGDTVAFTYDVGGFAGCELYGEYKEGDTWVRNSDAFAGGVGKITVLNGVTTIRARMAVVHGEETVYVTPERQVRLQPYKQGVLYFADCGATGDALHTGAVLGKNQSASDMAFGVDPVTGLLWGYDTPLIVAGDTGFNGTAEAMTSVASTEKAQGNTVTYKFTMPTPGTYKVAVGFYGGGSGWGERTQTLSVSGQTQKSITLREQTYSAEYYTVTTRAANELITVSVEKPTSETQDALLSAIVITEANAKVPLYTDRASSYNTDSVTYDSCDIMQDVAADLRQKIVTVYCSDGSTERIAASGNGVTQTVLESASFAAYAKARATLRMAAYPDMDAYVDYTWKQSGGSELYYNIDCGFVDINGTPPDDLVGMIGSKQSTTMDIAKAIDDETGNTWGYESNNSGSVFWANEADGQSSIREGGEGTGIRLTYSMNGFAANEPLFVEVVGNVHDWGNRNFTVYCNSSSMGTIRMTSAQPIVVATYACTANASGVLNVGFSSKATVASIKVWSRTDGQTELMPQAETVTVNKEVAGRSDMLTLGNLETGARLYLTDENDRVLGSFTAGSASMEIKPDDYLTGDSYELHIVQLSETKSVSEPVTVSFPGTVYTVHGGYVRDGESAVITFMPQGAAQGVTSLILRTPDGVSIDLTNGFFYRAKKNGTYTVILTSGGLTSAQPVTVDCIDTVDFRETFSTTAWTTGSVTMTLSPKAQSGAIAAMYVNGEPIELLDGEYSVTTAQNAEYNVRVITQAGNVYERTFAVNNIDAAPPVVRFDMDYTLSGVSLKYESQALSGGRLSVRFNDGSVQAVTDASVVDLTRAGKYTLTYTNAAGQSVTPKVYYVSYGAENAQLGNVTMDANGNVTVGGADSSALFRAGENTALGTLKADKAGKYYLQLGKGDETEVVVLQMASTASGKIVNGNGGESGSVGGMVTGIVLGVVMLAAAAGVCVWLVLKRRKTA